jgi:hypothetical protein
LWSFWASVFKLQKSSYYWEKLSAVPEAEQCGWLKDKYGFSWQVVPSGNARQAFRKYVHPQFSHHNPYFKGDRESLLSCHRFS